MWGQNWGQMIWGSAVSVPALGFWGTMLLGAAVGILGVRCLRGTGPRTLGALALALAVLVPIAARAVTLITFTNGTVADANQVNANFAGLTPISGNARLAVTALLDAPTIVKSPSFVAPRDLICTVTFDSYLAVFSQTTSSDSAQLLAFRDDNGTSVLPDGGTGRVRGYSKVLDIGASSSWNAAMTRRFSIAAGSTVIFACSITGFGAFSSPSTKGECIILYTCI